jgi:class 3 adenylate cyclase/alpha-beta hydrolase superfamily lysophospholipase
VQIPDVQYARSGDVSIAYQVVGEGPTDIVFFRGTTGDLLSTWDQPLLVRHVEGLAANARVLMLDKRGTGLSDRVREAPTLEARMDDVRAVMDAVDSKRAAIWTAHDGSRMAILFAATYPERTSGLVLFGPSLKGTRTADYPWAPSESDWQRRLASVRDGWGRRDYFEALLREWVPSKADDAAFANWFVGHMRRSLSPGAALSFFRASKDADVSDVISSVRVPTLIFFGSSERAEAEFVGERIRGSELVELPALEGIYTWVDDEPHEDAMRASERFIASLGRVVEPERVLATVLFTDIVDSTPRTAELGDRAWRELLERHNAVVRGRLHEFRGEEIDTAGDGFLASFDGPGRAISCARAIVEEVRSLGLEIRAGLHTGEFERHEQKLAGLGVAVGARVAGLARPGEVLVSGTVKDLVAGSELEFEERGTHELKGVPGEWRLYAVRA